MVSSPGLGRLPRSPGEAHGYRIFALCYALCVHVLHWCMRMSYEKWELRTGYFLNCVPSSRELTWRVLRTCVRPLPWKSAGAPTWDKIGMISCCMFRRSPMLSPRPLQIPEGWTSPQSPSLGCHQMSCGSSRVSPPSRIDSDMELMLFLWVTQMCKHSFTHIHKSLCRRQILLNERWMYWSESNSCSFMSDSL